MLSCNYSEVLETSTFKTYWLFSSIANKISLISSGFLFFIEILGKYMDSINSWHDQGITLIGDQKKFYLKFQPAV